MSDTRYYSRPRICPTPPQTQVDSNSTTGTLSRQESDNDLTEIVHNVSNWISENLPQADSYLEPKYLALALPPNVNLEDLVAALDHIPQRHYLKSNFLDGKAAQLHVRTHIPTLAHGRGTALATEIFGGLMVQCVRVNGTDDDVGIESTGQGPHLDRNLSFKEGDNTLMPLSRTPTELPSVVIEVGFSESMIALRKDADRWMGMAGSSQVKLVILVHLHKSDSRSTTKRVVIEFRERDPNNPTISCESTSCPTLEWRSATDVTDLNIPAELVYDVVPSFITAQGTPHF
ncbi:hypothetical protein B0H14DRAFT_2883572, partial [Mycena olivaceomarginata]